MKVKEAAELYTESLKHIYREGELSQLVFMVFEHVKKFSKTDLVLKREEVITREEGSEFKRILSELKSFRPIQYILGYAWFDGMKFLVNENVLIPRQETEELVDWIIRDVINEKRDEQSELKILDVCTGSGCIAIALKKKLLHTTLTAIDVSEKALAIAKENADKNNVVINFIRADVLKPEDLIFTSNQLYDIVVSNPPYVLKSEKAQMERKELDYEPHLALFVQDDDPLLFYKRIAEMAKVRLTPGGKLYFEINENKGNDVNYLLKQMGFVNVILRKDLNGKDRMVLAIQKNQE